MLSSMAATFIKKNQSRVRYKDMLIQFDSFLLLFPELESILLPQLLCTQTRNPSQSMSLPSTLVSELEINSNHFSVYTEINAMKTNHEFLLGFKHANSSHDWSSGVISSEHKAKFFSLIPFFVESVSDNQEGFINHCALLT